MSFCEDCMSHPDWLHGS